MKPKFASPNRRVSRTGASLVLITALVLWSGIAQGATHRRNRRPAPEAKSIVEAKAAPRPVRQWARLTTFNERWYPGQGRTFTTWW